MRTRSIVYLLLAVVFIASGCKKSVKSVETEPNAAEATLGAGDNGVAAAAAKEAIVGQWRIDNSGSVDVEGFSEEEAEFLRAMADTVRAGVDFREDGTLEMVARVADSPIERQSGTWKLLEVGTTKFQLELDADDTDENDYVSIEPLEDGSLIMADDDVTLLLRRANLEDFLADAAPTEDEEKPAGD